MKYILAIMMLAFAPASFSQTVDCNQLATFPDTAGLQGGGTAKKCVAACPTVRAPLCADVDGIFPQVYPRNQKAVGDYTKVVCSNIATFPKVTHNGVNYPKCVQKCQAVRPPKCVDYNTELR